jgi:hypothetical protein
MLCGCVEGAGEKAVKGRRGDGGSFMILRLERFITETFQRDVSREAVEYR